MAHGDHRLLGAVLGSGVQDCVEQRDQRRFAFEREALGAEIARLDHLLEEIGADQQAREFALLIRRRVARIPCAPGSSGAARDRGCA